MSGNQQLIQDRSFRTFYEDSDKCLWMGHKKIPKFDAPRVALLARVHDVFHVSAKIVKKVLQSVSLTHYLLPKLLR